MVGLASSIGGACLDLQSKSEQTLLIERIEAKWIDAFEAVLRLCALGAGDTVAILSETQSRPVLSELGELAAARIGCRVFQVRVPTVAAASAIPVRSTGASDAIAHRAPVIAALARATLVLDCTVEGLLHAAELPLILAGADGSRPRVLMVSNEHPEILERTVPNPALELLAKAELAKLKTARVMQVQSGGGTDLTIDLAGARFGAVWGYCAKPGQVAHWPGGLCLAFPAAGTVNGKLVLTPGDVNLTFKSYLRESIILHIESDYVTDIEGSGVDADLMRGYWASWGDRDAYAVSHVGWGVNPVARWDSLSFYDKRDCNGTELRAFAGNFLFSTGANEVAKRHTLGHFDLPMRGCSVLLDGVKVVDGGQLVSKAAP